MYRDFLKRLSALFVVSSFLIFSSLVSADSGRADYDLDDDGLIEINDLADLDEIRNHPDGKQLYSSFAGCPADSEGVAEQGCIGFELTADLDFDTNGDGQISELDSYWNNGKGWISIDDTRSPYDGRFSAILEGNGFQIRNYYSQQPLFGVIESATLRHLVFTGELTLVQSVGNQRFATLLAQRVLGASRIEGNYFAGGLVKSLSTSTSSNFASLVQDTSSETIIRANVINLVFQADYTHVLSSNSSQANSNGNLSLGLLDGFTRGHSSGDKHTNSYLSVESVTERDIHQLYSANYFEAPIEVLKCVTQANGSCDSVADWQDRVLFQDWQQITYQHNGQQLAYWDYGTTQQLPGLNIYGKIIRDSDGDGVLDEEDDFVNNRAAAIDADGDGHPDRWAMSCNQACIDNSGLPALDLFPQSAAAWQNADLDEFPDQWAETCANGSCPEATGLTLDAQLNDSDNDGITNDIDTDDDGNGLDRDADSNGLLDIYTAEEFLAIQHDSKGQALSINGEVQASGCPLEMYLGELKPACHGYELKNDIVLLNYQQNIRLYSDFDGNGHTITLDSSSSVITANTNGFSLFYRIKNSHFKNLVIVAKKPVVITDNHGASLAYAIHDSEIEGVAAFVNMQVIGTYSNVPLAGLAVQLFNSKVKASWYVGELSASFARSGSPVAGLVYDLREDSEVLASLSNASIPRTNKLKDRKSLFSSVHVKDRLNNQYLNSRNDISLEALRCATTDSLTVSDACLSNESLEDDYVVFENWLDYKNDHDQPYWQFGDSQQLPALNINGKIYRDNDGDGVLDDDDQWPQDIRIGYDQDLDGYPDLLNMACDEECYAQLNIEGIFFDAFPEDNNFFLDADVDGKPDGFTTLCDSQCQITNTHLIDTLLGDGDNDGQPDNNDESFGSYYDIDRDNDGLIEISSLQALEDIYYGPRGQYYYKRNYRESGDFYYSSEYKGCGAGIYLGAITSICRGYELTQDLDFDSDGSGQFDAGDDYWNEGEGWKSIGYKNSSRVLSFIFEGNGHTIKNYTSMRNYYNAFFNKAINSEIRNLIIEDAKVQGNSRSSALIFEAENSEIKNIKINGQVTGYSDAAFIAYSLKNSKLTNIAVAGKVIASQASGIASNIYDSKLLRIQVSGQLEGTRVSGLAQNFQTSSLQAGLITGRLDAPIPSNRVAGFAYTIDSQSKIIASLITAYIPPIVDDNIISNIQASATPVVKDSYWALGRTSSDLKLSKENLENENSYGIKLKDIECLTAADITGSVLGSHSCFTSQHLSLDTQLFSQWQSLGWSFGSNQQLPYLDLAEYSIADSDGDGVLDSDDAFATQVAASLDADNDGYPDEWHTSCDTQCRIDSNLKLDSYPADQAIALDEDYDDLPDAFTSVCDATCQANYAGVAIDLKPNDTDNDGTLNDVDSSDKADGAPNVDLDRNGYIEISTLAQFDAMRFQLDGAGYRSSADAELDQSGCPRSIIDGQEVVRCSGYELINDLNFDSNDNGIFDQQDLFWNDGKGWLPFSNGLDTPFSAKLKGNGYVIHNLYSQSDKGIFGYLSHAKIIGIGFSNARIESLTTAPIIALKISDQSELGQIFYSGLLAGDKVYGLAEYITDGSFIYDGFISGYMQSRSPYNLDNFARYLNSYSQIKNMYVSAKTLRYESERNSDFVRKESSANTEDLYWNNNDQVPVTRSYTASVFSLSLAKLKCPVAANTSAENSSCLSADGSGEGFNRGVSIYNNWSNDIWNFGNSDQPPALVFNNASGAHVYRDSDNDGVIDSKDKWPDNFAVAIDHDGDNYPDSWAANCDKQCRDDSGFIIDMFPQSKFAWLDADFDGLVDQWVGSCVADNNCPQVSGLTFDENPNDSDNDGILNGQDNDFNGQRIADKDGDGLIEIANLEQLDDMRLQAKGFGYSDSATDDISDYIASGCPVSAELGKAKRRCHGFELVADLDFDTNANGYFDAQDQFWNEGKGWLPIEELKDIIFEGNGHQILNLNIAQSTQPSLALITLIKNSRIRRLGIAGTHTHVRGTYRLGLLVSDMQDSHLEAVYAIGSISSSHNVWQGLLAASMKGSSSIEASYAMGQSTRAIALVGEAYNEETRIRGSYILARQSHSPNPDFNSGALVGQFQGTKVGATVSDLIDASYWVSDHDNSIQAVGLDEDLSSTFPSVAGFNLAQMQCAQADTTAASDCINTGELFVDWGTYKDQNGQAYWHFGNQQQLPVLNLNGRIHRDWDFNGSDENDDQRLAFFDLDGDGIYPPLDVYPFIPIADLLDEDNDGVPDVCDQACLALGYQPDKYLNDTDNDAASNDIDNDYLSDNGAPIILEIERLGISEAADEKVDGVFAIRERDFNIAYFANIEEAVSTQDMTSQLYLNGQLMLANDEGMFVFSTGIPALTATVTDKSGNVSQPKAVDFYIYPVVSMKTTSSLTGEGRTAQVTAELSGPSPVYPVVVDFAIDTDTSTVEQSDFAEGFDLTAMHRVVINAGDGETLNTQADFELPIVHDQVDEADKTADVEIVHVGLDLTREEQQVYPEAWYAFSQPDAGIHKIDNAHQHQLTITDQNIAPKLSFIVQQAGKEVSEVNAAGGEVTIKLQVSDVNGFDEHTFTWQLGGLAVSSPTAEQLTFDPAAFAGQYTITVEVSDNGVGQLSSSIEIQLNIIQDAVDPAPSNGGGKKKGGGALIWLLPMVLLFWRRRLSY